MTKKKKGRKQEAYKQKAENIYQKELLYTKSLSFTKKLCDYKIQHVSIPFSKVILLW